MDGYNAAMDTLPTQMKVRTLGQTLRTRLIGTGATQKEIAGATGIAQTTVSRIISGRVSPRLETADTLFRWLDGRKQ